MQISPINKIGHNIDKQVGKVFEYTTKWKWMTRNLEEGFKEPAKFGAKMFVISIITKDVIGCIFYTYQSLNNKKIPEEKRKFVAALDLMNGIIMVGGQFLIGKVIEASLTPWLLSKYTGLLKNKVTGAEDYVNSEKPLASDNIIEVTKKVLLEKAGEIKTKYGVDVSKLTPQEANSIGEQIIGRIGKGSKKFSAFETGFGIFITAIATTALTKRTLAPLLSTPLAGWFKENYMDKKKTKPQHDRVYYEWSSLGPKYNNKIDTTSFSKVSSK
ncbi:MAG: hypothetical protein WCG95_06970 [bacterium]